MICTYCDAECTEDNATLNGMNHIVCKTCEELINNEE